MTTHATAQFAVKSWDEKTWDGQPYGAVTGRRLTHARITYTYTGDLEGEGTVQYLMFYRDDGTAAYIGLEEFAGSLHGKPGSFVLQYTGSYADSTARGTCTILPGSGTGALSGISGRGEGVAAGHEPSYPFTLDYDLP